MAESEPAAWMFANSFDHGDSAWLSKRTHLLALREQMSLENLHHLTREPS